MFILNGNWIPLQIDICDQNMLLQANLPKRIYSYLSDKKFVSKIEITNAIAC